MNATTTGAILAQLVAAYPRQEISKQTVAVYVRQLADLEPEQLAAAADLHIRRSRFFPSVAELRQGVLEHQQEMDLAPPPAARAWGWVLEAMAQHRAPYNPAGGYIAPTLPDVPGFELAKQVAERIGGTTRIDHTPAAYLGALRRDFIEEYQRMLDRMQAGLDVPALTRRAAGQLRGMDVAGALEDLTRGAS